VETHEKQHRKLANCWKPTGRSNSLLPVRPLLAEPSGGTHSRSAGGQADICPPMQMDSGSLEQPDLGVQFSSCKALIA
jgi:hypothetical protein